MQRYRQKLSKMPPKWGFPTFATPKSFSQKSGSVTFVTFVHSWYLSFMKKISKKQWTASKIFKDSRTDGQDTDGQG